MHILSCRKKEACNILEPWGASIAGSEADWLVQQVIEQ